MKLIFDNTQQVEVKKLSITDIDSDKVYKSIHCPSLVVADSADGFIVITDSAVYGFESLSALLHDFGEFEFVEETNKTATLTITG